MMVRMAIFLCLGVSCFGGDLHSAIAQYESGNYTRAYNRRRNAAGYLQIRPCVVSDCNRIVGYQRWTLADRYNRQKSREMFNFYLDFYGKQYTKATGRQPSSEVLARIWNGGPNGWRNHRTRGYWYEIRARL